MVCGDMDSRVMLYGMGARMDWEGIRSNLGLTAFVVSGGLLKYKLEGNLLEARVLRRPAGLGVSKTSRSSTSNS